MLSQRQFVARYLAFRDTFLELKTACYEATLRTIRVRAESRRIVARTRPRTPDGESDDELVMREAPGVH